MDERDDRLYAHHLLQTAEAQIDKRIHIATKIEMQNWLRPLMRMAQMIERELNRRGMKVG